MTIKYILFKDKLVHVHLDHLTIGGENIDRVGDNCKDASFKVLFEMSCLNPTFTLAPLSGAQPNPLYFQKWNICK